MGRWGGLATGMRERRQDNLRERQFNEQRRRTGASETAREQQMGLSRERFAEQRRQTGVAEGMREEQFGLAKGRELRARKSEEAKRVQIANKDMEDRKASRISRVHQALTVGDDYGALEAWNDGLDPNKMATGISFGDNNSIMIDRRGSTASIPEERYRRYVKKDPVAYALAQRKGSNRMSADERNYKSSLLLGEMGGKDGAYDFSGFAVEKPNANQKAQMRRLLYGAKAGLSAEQLALETNMPMRLPPRIKSKVDDVTTRLEAIQSKRSPWTEAGRVQRAAEIAALEAHKSAIFDRVIEHDPVVQLTNRKIVSQFSAFDTNQDQVIDEADQDYQTAQRIVDIMGRDPANREKLMQRYGARMLAQAEALVQAVKQKEKITAQRRVGLGR